MDDEVTAGPTGPTFRSPGPAPSPAERARTLALGVVSGVVYLSDGRTARQYRVQQVTEPDGSIGLLVPNAHDAARRFGECSGPAEAPGVLDVLDVPPGRLCLPRARLCITGWIETLPVPEQRRMAGRVAGSRPLGRLLDVGGECSLFRLDIGEIRLTNAEGTHVVDERAFRRAEPDPLYEVEDHIIVHLQDHHPDELVDLARRLLPPGSIPSGAAVTGLDRYGFDLQCTAGGGYRTLRVRFPAPVTDEHTWSRALRRVLRLPAGAGSAR